MSSSVGSISPHFGGGSGLKRIRNYGSPYARANLPSLRWGERIETAHVRCNAHPSKYLPSLRWGERIETDHRDGEHADADISPHFGGGSGLKHLNAVCAYGEGVYLPSLRWGERIETHRAAYACAVGRHLPSLRWGERIETQRTPPRRPSWCASPLTSVGGAD